MYRCQSAHKLVEIDARFRLFSKFQPRTIVDLAAAPGGFAEVALEQMRRCGPSPSQPPSHPPLVIAVDQRPIEPMPGLMAVRGNILQHQQILQTVQRTLLRTSRHSTQASPPVQSPRTVDMVLHDGVSVVKGQHAFSVTYAQNQMALSTLLLAAKLFDQFSSCDMSRREDGAHTGNTSNKGAASPPPPAGASVPVCFVSKVLRCPHSAQVVAATNALFRHVVVFKPEASRAESQETYVVAAHFLPNRWQRLVSARDGGIAPQARSQRSHPKAVTVTPALFSMPPTPQDCGDVRRMVWSCLGCGRTCVGAQPCGQCGPFQSGARVEKQAH